MRKILVENLKNMSTDQLVGLYRQGYSIEGVEEIIPPYPEYISLSPATCPGTITQGTTKTVTVAITTVGTEPYTLKFYVDDVQKTVSPTWDGTNKRFTFPWTFNETVGTHKYAAEVVDSCATGAKTSNRDYCNINIAAVCVEPVVTMTIPS